VPAGCFDAQGARVEPFHGAGFGEALAAAKHAGAHAVAGQGVVHEHDEAVPVGHAAAAQGQTLDRELDLFVLAGSGEGGGHGDTVPDAAAPVKSMSNPPWEGAATHADRDSRSRLWARDATRCLPGVAHTITGGTQ